MKTYRELLEWLNNLESKQLDTKVSLEFNIHNGRAGTIDTYFKKNTFIRVSKNHPKLIINYYID